MALIKCVNCGHMISDRGAKCPKCGTAKFVATKTYSNKPQEEYAKYTLSTCIGVVIIYILIIVSLYVVQSLQKNINGYNGIYENEIYYEPVERNQYYLEE